MKAKQPAKKQPQEKAPTQLEAMQEHVNLLNQVYDEHEKRLLSIIECLNTADGRIAAVESKQTIQLPVGSSGSIVGNVAEYTSISPCHRYGHRLVAMNPGEHPICERCGLTLREINPKYDEQVGGDPESVAHAVVASWQEQAMQRNTGK